MSINTAEIRRAAKAGTTWIVDGAEAERVCDEFDELTADVFRLRKQVQRMEPAVEIRSEYSPKWEHVVTEPSSSRTDRLWVMGGWLYRVECNYGPGGAQTVALQFVPEVFQRRCRALDGDAEGEPAGGYG